MAANSIIVRILFCFVIILSCLGIILIFYLSWLPEPMLGKYDLLPHWITRWTDAQVNDNVRTSIPLFLLGFLTSCWLIITKRNWCWWISSWTGLVMVVLIAEMGQLLLPHRNFDWGDVAWGAVGSLSGLIIIPVFFMISQLLMKATKRL